jgi:hypothetical protein
MSKLSELTTKVYASNWAYLKAFISDINNAESTLKEIKAIKTTVTGKPVSQGILKNYLSAVMFQVRDNATVREMYSTEMKTMKSASVRELEKQEGTELMRKKLEGLTWDKIIEYKNKIIESKAISEENKLLIRLYTECESPVRNDFAGLRVFIDEAKPLGWVGNCLLLTESATVLAKPKKFVVKKTVPILELPECGGIVPVRNIMWLQEFKTSKHDSQSDIIQSLPKQLAIDIIAYCKTYKTNILFDYTHYAVSKRIISMFYQVSEKRIGINVLRHLFIMTEYKDTPMLHTRKQTAKRMGHSVNMQELYRIR